MGLLRLLNRPHPKSLSPRATVYTQIESGWRLMILARKSQNSPITYPLLGGAQGWVYHGANGRKPAPPVGRPSQEGISAAKYLG